MRRFITSRVRVDFPHAVQREAIGAVRAEAFKLPRFYFNGTRKCTIFIKYNVLWSKLDRCDVLWSKPESSCLFAIKIIGKCEGRSHNRCTSFARLNCNIRTATDWIKSLTYNWTYLYFDSLLENKSDWFWDSDLPQTSLVRRISLKKSFFTFPAEKRAK